MNDRKKRIENVAEALHIYYLEATKELSPSNYNQRAQKGYNELNDEQKSIDRFIAEKIIEIVDAKVNLAIQNEHERIIGLFSRKELMKKTGWLKPIHITDIRKLINSVGET